VGHARLQQLVVADVQARHGNAKTISTKGTIGLARPTRRQRKAQGAFDSRVDGKHQDLLAAILPGGDPRNCLPRDRLSRNARIANARRRDGHDSAAHSKQSPTQNDGAQGKKRHPDIADELLIEVRSKVGQNVEGDARAQRRHRMPAPIKPIILHGDWLISKTPSTSALVIAPPLRVDGTRRFSPQAHQTSWRR